MFKSFVLFRIEECDCASNADGINNPFISLHVLMSEIFTLTNLKHDCCKIFSKAEAGIVTFDFSKLLFSRER